MKKLSSTISKIEWIYNNKGECQSIRVYRGNFYQNVHEYAYNWQSDSQDNLSTLTQNRDEWQPYFEKNKITVKPAWFVVVRPDGSTAAAGSLEHCKQFRKEAYRIIRRDVFA